MDARVKQLVNMIEDAQPVAVAVLAKRLEVSERAVRNYIHRANDSLAGVARIVGSKGQYRIDVARADELARLLDGVALAHPGIPDTRDGRVSFLLNDLLMRSQWVTIEEYADLLYVSARTLSNDMRLVEQKLAQFDLTLEKRPRYGIRVAGGESQRRLCLASLVRPVLPDTDDAKLAERLRAIAACVDDALTAYLTGTLEPAQKAYNEHYVCDYPLGLAGLDQYRAQHESLVRIDLERYAARLEQAQRDCKDRFRKDILFRMKDDIFNARRQFRELNKVMEQLTYGEEVYRFELEPSRDPQLAAFYQVIVDKGNQQMTEGDSLDNLAATADPAYERQVDELMEKIMADVDENTRARQEGRTGGVTLSDYVDYRTYLDYDIKVTNRVTGQQAYLSRVSRDSSGGENQAPFYVAICASLLQIYEKSENSIRLVLLDEAFSKMTSDRIRPMMELFRRLQLQVLLISTVEKSTAIQPYCDITYSIVRHGDTNAIAPFIRLAAE